MVLSLGYMLDEATLPNPSAPFFSESRLQHEVWRCLGGTISDFDLPVLDNDATEQLEHGLALLCKPWRLWFCQMEAAHKE